MAGGAVARDAVGLHLGLGRRDEVEVRLPEQVDVVADCVVLKLGKRLAVIEVTLRSDGTEAPIAHATGT